MNLIRESLFYSAMRSFLKTLMAVIGFAIASFVILIAFSMFSSPYRIQDLTNVTILPDENGSSAVLANNSPVILQIDITDEIGNQNLNFDIVSTILHSSREGLFAHDRVKAILLNINSPGGTVTDSDNIYRALLAYKAKHNVPVYAYVQGLCASGAYYISCAADKVSATPTSIVGSVGVILGPQFNFANFMDRYGVKAKIISEGINKAPFLPFIKWPEGEEAKKAEQPIRDLTAFYYQRFVSIVTKARPMLSEKELINNYGANIFAAETAKNYGYIDEADSTREEVLKELAKGAGIEGPYQCVSMSLVQPFFADVLQGKFSLMKMLLPDHRPPYHRYLYLME